MRLFINGETCEKFLDLVSFCVDNFNNSLRRYLKNNNSKYLVRRIDDVNDIQIELDGSDLHLFIEDYLICKHSKSKTIARCYSLLADDRLIRIEDRLHILSDGVYKKIPIEVDYTQKYPNSIMVYSKIFVSTSKNGESEYSHINMHIMNDRMDIECMINNKQIINNYVLYYDSAEFNKIMSMDYIELIDYLKSR